MRDIEAARESQRAEALECIRFVCIRFERNDIATAGLPFEPPNGSWTCCWRSIYNAGREKENSRDNGAGRHSLGSEE